MGSDLAEELERWIDACWSFGGRRINEQIYDYGSESEVDRSFHERFPDWTAPEDLVLFGQALNRLPYPVLPWVDNVVPFRAATEICADPGQYIVDDYRESIRYFTPDGQVPAPLVDPQAVIFLFNSDEALVGMETVGPATGAMFISETGLGGWVARSLAELFNRAVRMFEHDAYALDDHRAVIPYGSWDLNALVRQRLFGTDDLPSDDQVNRNLKKIAWEVQRCNADLRELTPGRHDLASIYEWRWEDIPQAPT